MFALKTFSLIYTDFLVVDPVQPGQAAVFGRAAGTRRTFHVVRDVFAKVHLLFDSRPTDAARRAGRRSNVLSTKIQNACKQELKG